MVALHAIWEVLAWRYTRQQHALTLRLAQRASQLSGGMPPVRTSTTSLQASQIRVGHPSGPWRRCSGACSSNSGQQGGGRGGGDGLRERV